MHAKNKTFSPDAYQPLPLHKSPARKAPEKQLLLFIVLNYTQHYQRKSSSSLTVQLALVTPGFKGYSKGVKTWNTVTVTNYNRC